MSNRGAVRRGEFKIKRRMKEKIFWLWGEEFLSEIDAFKERVCGEVEACDHAFEAEIGFGGFVEIECEAVIFFFDAVSGSLGAALPDFDDLIEDDDDHGDMPGRDERRV